MSAPIAFPEVSADIAHSSLLCGGVETLTASPHKGELPGAFVRRVEAYAQSRGLQIFHGVLFGDPKLYFSMALPTWPLSFLGRHDTPACVFFGGRFEALPVGSFQWVKGLDGRVEGAVWEDASARYLWAGTLLPRCLGGTPKIQAEEVWGEFESLLVHHGLSVRHIVRTWFYNDHILDWYDDFNAVRTAFFKKHDIFGHFVPASTGIGVSNPMGAALCAGFIAMAPKSRDALKLSMAPSPLQCPAYNYSSAFSRAAACEFPEGKLLFVSGTASIEPEGRTAHLGNLDKQIDLTLCVVGAILEASHMRWEDVTRAIAYFPKIEWMDAFRRRLKAEGIPEFPFVYAHSDVCRGDLMFELELDAVRKK